MAEQRKPYVRYELSAQIGDKGIAYAAKKTINTFLRTHGYDGHVTDLDSSSDSFRAVIELFDNGKYDFNVKALYEHLEASGRLPTKESLRPKIIIKPLSCDGGLNVTQQAPDAIAFSKTVEGLNRKVDEKEDEIRHREDTIKNLNDILTERQSVIEESKKRVIVLEQRVKDAAPKQYENALDAVINGHLKNALESYMEASIDIHDLSESHNLAIFERLGGSG